jgi:NAD(P)H-nitrite reductase large subunit
MDKKKIIICRCEEVSLYDVEKAIEDGARTVNEVKKRTRAGMGLCQGKSCGRLIEKIIAQETGAKPETILPTTFRPPVRPVKLSIVVGDSDEK